MADAKKIDTSKVLEPSAQDLLQQIDVLKTDVSRLTSTLTDLGKAKGRDIKADVTGKAEDLKLKAENQALEARIAAEGAVEDVEKYIRKNPMTALGIAAFVGLIIGIITSRR